MKVWYDTGNNATEENSNNNAAQENNSNNSYVTNISSDYNDQTKDK